MSLTKSQKAKQKKLYDTMVVVEAKPHLNLSIKDLPAIKDWEVGKNYTIELKTKMTSKNIGGWDGKRPMEAGFDVMGVKDAS